MCFLQVRELSGATIEVDEDPPPRKTNDDQQRTITITGSPDEVRTGADMIRELRESKFPHHLFLGRLADDVTCDIMIPVDRVGLVLGANGVMIKSLQQQAGKSIVEGALIKCKWIHDQIHTTANR